VGGFLQRVGSAGRVWGEAVTEKLVRHIVKQIAATIGGCIQRISSAVNDRIGIEPTP
jgi:hypothetical protein